MTKEDMVQVLRSVGVNENTVTAMCNAFDMGFEQGAQAGNALREVVVEAVAICHEIDSGDTADTHAFWQLHEKMKGMV